MLCYLGTDAHALVAALKPPNTEREANWQQTNDKDIEPRHVSVIRGITFDQQPSSDSEWKIKMPVSPDSFIFLMKTVLKTCFLEYDIAKRGHTTVIIDFSADDLEQLRCLGSELRQVLQNKCALGEIPWYEIRSDEAEFKGGKTRRRTELITEVVESALH